MRHCGYCGNSGHNRRTCPNRSPDVKQSDNAYYKRYRRKRTCRYCRNTDHDKRKCEKLVADRNDWIAKNAKFRKRFIEDAKLVGFGVGALIKRKYWNDETFCLVNKINWDTINVDNRYNYAMHVFNIGNPDNDEQVLNTPMYFGLDGDERAYYIKMNKNEIEIVNPVNNDDLESKLPADWFSGKCEERHMPSSLR